MERPSRAGVYPDPSAPELSIHEIEFDRTFEVPPHPHDHADAMLVLDGEIELLGEMCRWRDPRARCRDDVDCAKVSLAGPWCL